MQVPFVEQTPESTGYITPASFGCTIKGGKKEASLSQDSLSQLMALWGSAMTVTLSEAVNSAKDPFLNEIDDKLIDLNLIAPFSFPNWENPLETLHFRDAGLSFNVPLPPLLEEQRNVDVILVVDVSANLNKSEMCGLELIKAAVWAEKTNKPFPVKASTLLSQRNTLQKPVVFKGGKGVPTVVYFPIYVDKALTLDTFDLDSRDLTKRGALYDKAKDLWMKTRENVKAVVREKM